MKNPIDYLWYKTYKSKLYNRGQSMGLVLLANLYTICFLIFGMASISFVYSILLIILTFALTYPYERYKKQAKIIRKYYNESEKSRIRGNIIVVLYFILSFVVLFLVAIYHITIQNIL
jgi:ABC-type Fe3+ transport system permease subunit